MKVSKPGVMAFAGGIGLSALFGGEPNLMDAAVDRINRFCSHNRGETALTYKFEETVSGLEQGENRYLVHEGNKYQISLVPK